MTLIAIAIAIAVALLFKVRNMESATVSLFPMSMTMPLSSLVLLVCALGMLTGGMLLALLRTSVGRAWPPQGGA
jgi:putative membrane protein